MTATLPLAESEDLVLVRDSARGLLQDAWPATRAVALATDCQALKQMWVRAAAQGWTALAPTPDEMGLPAAIVLTQELGRAACPLPLMESVLANAALANATEPAAASLLAQLHSGEAIVSWVFGPDSGDAQAFDLQVGGTLEGRAAFVENSAIATHFLVVTGRGDEIAIVSRASAGLAITSTPGLNVPPLAWLAFKGVDTFQLVGGSQPVGELLLLARLFLAARATGSAGYGLEQLTEYAKLRSQFGRKIGQYQAIQHKLANCFTSVETCRLALLAAGRAPLGHRTYAAAVAVVNAGQLLRQVVLELHHGFGGVSFWDEHELPRHFRRIHGDVTRLGGVQQARRALAAVLLEHGTMPDVALTPAADAFRAEVRAWLAQHWDGVYPPETYDLPVNHRKARQDFSRKLGAKGWLGITWPSAYGGQERSALEHLVFEEEMAYAEAPTTFHNTAANMIGPTLVTHGTDAQKAYFLPGISSGEISFALGYSEPDYGSDLAGIKTAATRTPEGGWVVRGQKIFTSTAGFSTHVWLAARTDPQQPRHGGISVFAVPLDTPGITIQPMSGLNGHRSNVVFYDEVKLPADALIGEENGGWKVITDALAYERVTLGAIGARARGYFDRLLSHVRADAQLRADPVVHDRIGTLGAEIEASRLLAVRTAQVVEQGEVPLWQAAMLKVQASELMERLSETAFDLLGTGATLQEDSEGALCGGAFEYGVRDALLYTIGGGTNEIQRTLIAQRGLDLPR
uniref:Acyl-CoA dehydrogenase fadE12 n=1 Tax=Sym plasmid TaxID=28430 RepID=A0A515HIG3_9ZZZZ|nr:Acyl-CoA dehydrogenase fadE12 [Sym plasmid]